MLSFRHPTGSEAIHVASGTISFTDVDLTDRPVASAAFSGFSYLNAGSVDVTLQLTAKQLAAISAVDQPLTVVQAPGNTNEGSATWSYSTADNAFDFLADGEILTLTYTATVNDGHGGVVTKPINVTVTGSNDAVEITSGAQTAAIAEVAGAHGSYQADTANGSIKFADVDLTDTHEVTVTGVTASGVKTGLADYDTQLDWLTLGYLADSTDRIAGSQAWSFAAPDHYFDYLANGETVTLTYTVKVDDHHGGFTSQDVLITVTGSNDAPTVTASNGAIIEMAGTGNTALDHAGGSISFADLDLSDRPIVSASFSGYAYKAANGTSNLSLTAQQQHDLGVALTLTPAGGNTNNGSVSWSYDVADSQFDFLANNETLTLTYTATVDDHHGGVVTKPVTVTITGSNDTPTLAAELTGKLTDTAANDGFGNITGVLDGSDADHGETATLSYRVVDAEGHATNEPVAGAFGSLTVNADGTYTYIPNAAAINALHGGNSIDTFTVQTVDVHGAFATAVLTIDVNGANDTPTLAAELAGTLADTAAADTFADITGTLDGSDRDSGETATLSYGVVDAPGHATNEFVAGMFGSLKVNADGTYTYVPDAAAINALHEGRLHRHLHGADHRCPRCRRYRNSDCQCARRQRHALDRGRGQSSRADRRGDLAARACRRRERELARCEHGDVRRPDGRFVIQQRCRSRQFHSTALGADFWRPEMPGSSSAPRLGHGGPVRWAVTRKPGYDQISEHRRQRHRDDHLCVGEERLRAVLGVGRSLQYHQVLRRNDARCLLYRR